MADFDFNAPYVDRRTWIIDHLQDLVLEPKEILVVLLIDFFNQQHISIDHELISEKLKISVDEVEDIFTELSDKGYLTLDYANGSLIFRFRWHLSSGVPSMSCTAAIHSWNKTARCRSF